MSVSINYHRTSSDEHRLELMNTAISDITIDYQGIPREKRDGTAVRLLGASVLYCFGASLGAALETRGATVNSLTGSIEVKKGKDEVARTKVTEIAITVEVDIDDKDVAILEKCKKIIKRGCFMTYTLEDSIDIEYRIKRKDKDV